MIKKATDSIVDGQSIVQDTLKHLKCYVSTYRSCMCSHKLPQNPEAHQHHKHSACSMSINRPLAENPGILVLYRSTPKEILHER